MFLSLCYLALRWVLQLAALRVRSTDLKDLEIVVLRHELAILRRSGVRLVSCAAIASVESFTSTFWRRDHVSAPHTMNMTLWVLQALLAVAFLAHGWFILFPPAELLDLMNASTPPAFRRFVGVAEVLVAVGLTLPGITWVLPW